MSGGSVRMLLRSAHEVGSCPDFPGSRRAIVFALKTLRVLHVIKGLGPGGAERLLVSLAEASRDMHCEVAYVLPWKQHLVAELEQIGVATHLLGGRRGLLDPWWVARLVRLAGRGKFDVVHLHSPAVASAVRPMLMVVGRQIVVSTEHNVWSSHGVITRISNGVTLPLEDATFAVSNEVVRSAWRRRRPGMKVVLHGVPLAQLRLRCAERHQARARLGVEVSDVLVVIVANLRAPKAYPVLFEAAARAIGQVPQLRFVAVGQGPLESRLRSELAALQLGNRFQMLGYHQDPPAVLAAADLFTLSSDHEGLPIALLEAMAIGIPPVATAVGGIPEVVTSGVHGLLVPPRDPAALAGAYIRLAGKPDLRRELGAASAQRAGDFDIARTAEIFRSQYLDLVGRRRP